MLGSTVSVYMLPCTCCFGIDKGGKRAAGRLLFLACRDPPVPRTVKICASFVKIWCLTAAFGLCYDKFMTQKGTSKVQGGKE
jgi:hypothetical protein